LLSKFKSGCIHVTDGHRKGVGSVGINGFTQAKQISDHLSHLIFVSFPVSHNGLLNLKGAILVNRQPCIDSSQYGGASSLPQLQSALHISGEENILYGHALGSTFLYDESQLLIDPAQPVWKRESTGDGYGAIGHMVELIAAAFHDSVARAPGAGINSDGEKHVFFHSTTAAPSGY
jgi:hypothetical protein